MGTAEIEFQVIERKNWRGKLRYNTRIVDTLNNRILFASNQGYSRRIDAMKAIGLVQRYGAIAEVNER